jgi:hypothetical protein
MTLNELYNLTNYIIRNEVRGNPCTPEQFELLINARQIDYFQKLYENYERTQEFTDSLRTFKTIVDLTDLGSVVNDEYITLPADYFHFSTMSYINGSVYYPFDMVTKDQAIMRKISTLTVPTVTEPICYEFDGNLYIEPYEDSYDLQMTYLRYPNDVVFSYGINADDEFVYYDESSSVSIDDGTELEWNEDDQFKILALVLRDLGVSLNETGIRQYAEIIYRE